MKLVWVFIGLIAIAFIFAAMSQRPAWSGSDAYVVCDEQHHVLLRITRVSAPAGYSYRVEGTYAGC